MGNAGTQDSGSPGMATTDLWKFFEERITQQKASMYQLVTWITGFAAVVLGFAVKEGFEGHFATAHPPVLYIFGGVGLVVLVLAFLIIRDHGRHIPHAARFVDPHHPLRTACHLAFARKGGMLAARNSILP